MFATDSSEPTLQGYGANRLISNTGHHVANLSSGVTIAAQGNYWYQNTGSPNYAPKSAKILGSVDYANALSSGPNPVSTWPGPSGLEPDVVTGLGRAHPNPFNPTVNIPYALTEPAHVEIAVYDVAGRLVRTLVRGSEERGQHAVTWNGTDDQGVPVASSVYFVRMRAGSFVETQKIVLLK